LRHVISEVAPTIGLVGKGAPPVQSSASTDLRHPHVYGSEHNREKRRPIANIASSRRCRWQSDLRCEVMATSRGPTAGASAGIEAGS